MSDPSLPWWGFAPGHYHRTVDEFRACKACRKAAPR